MGEREFDVVTGAFSYTGKYIARQLLASGRAVRTLTGHPRRPNPFGQRVSAAPLDFGRPAALAASLDGAATLYNTYWVRFCRGSITFDQAVENTKVLVRAAERAGLRRIVHISITNASADSPLPYFRGKAVAERFVAESQLSYALVRPTVVFGKEDILINNIAWLLRRWPVFAIPGTGDYRVQPVFVEDLARIAVEAGQGTENVVVDAVGPEVFRFDELVGLIGRRIGTAARIVRVSPGLALLVARVIGWAVDDVLLTREEIGGLMAGLLVSDQPVMGSRRLSAWLEENADRIGRRYASELKRHFDQGAG